MNWIEWADLYERTVDTPLSKDFRILLDEANKLLQLKTELGRMPASRFKTHLMDTIDQWFDVDSSPRANHAEHHDGTPKKVKGKQKSSRNMR